MLTIKAVMIESTVLRSEDGRLYHIYNYKGKFDSYMNISAYYMLERGPDKYIVKRIVIPK